jgi:thymidine kinase
MGLVKRGTLDVYCGPMYAGKTSHLLKRVLWLDHQQKRVLVLKPAKDNRYAEEKIVTHNQLSYPCISFVAFTEIESKYNIKPYNYDTVCLDEVQFMDPAATLKTVERWLSEGVNVIACGLDQDSRGTPFETTSLLMGLADCVDKITATCNTCGKNATKTYRVHAEGDRVMVGSMGLYEPRCKDHWEPR